MSGATAADIYPDVEKHLPEWKDQVRPVARKLLESVAWRHHNKSVSVEELSPYIEDAGLRAFCKFKSQFTVSPVTSFKRNRAGEIVGGTLNSTLAGWIKAEANADATHGVRRLLRGTQFRLATEKELKRAGELQEELEAKFADDTPPWLRDLLDRDEFLRSVLSSIPDPVDQTLMALGYLMIRDPNIPGATLYSDDLASISQVLVQVFDRDWGFHVCPHEVAARLKRGGRWVKLFTALQGDLNKMPEKDGGGRSWQGHPRGVDGTCALPIGRSWGGIYPALRAYNRFLVTLRERQEGTA